MQIKLTAKTKSEWVKVVLNNFAEFLKDHADCERKSSEMALSFVGKYPQKREIISSLITISIESLQNFQKAHALLSKLDSELDPEMSQDLYLKELTWASRSGRKERFIDRMIIAALVEARNSERFLLISSNHSDKQISKLYADLANVKERHSDVYLELLKVAGISDQIIKSRLKFFVDVESKIVKESEPEPALH
jgi:tRNA-(ms[2]io[6]A)-hydroxylase